MSSKRRERRRAANDAAKGDGYVGGEYWLDWDNDDCEDFEEDAVYVATPLSVPLLAFAMEAA